MRHMKRSSVESWIESVGETGCQEPAFKQNINYDFRLIYELLIGLLKSRPKVEQAYIKHLMINFLGELLEKLIITSL